MHSCIYEGQVSHRRFSPVDHGFQNRLFMAYLDLDELEDLTQEEGLISRRRFAAASFDEDAHLVESDEPLRTGVESLVLQRTGMQLTGPIRLLTQLRYFGYYFSPLNLYYCFDADGDDLQAVVAEVGNTPWGEQHCYVLWEGNRVDWDAGLQFRHTKDFHVSPFMQMEVEYQWLLNTPGEELTVSIENLTREFEVQGEDDHGSPTPSADRFFTAAMTLKKRPLTKSSLGRMKIRYPVMTMQIMAAIYWQALKLWWKKCPSYRHPQKQQQAVAS